MNVFKEHCHIWIKRTCLIEYGIQAFTIDRWRERKQAIFRIVKGQSFIALDSIPTPSRAKIPSVQEFEAILSTYQINEQQAHWNKIIDDAYNYGYAKHRKTVINYLDEIGQTLPEARITEAAKTLAVFDIVISKTPSKQAPFIQQAVSRYFPGIKTINNYAEAKCRASKDLLSYAVKGSWFNRTEKKYDGRVCNWVIKLMKDPLIYNASTIRKKLSKLCEKEGIKCPGSTWVKEFVREHKRNNIDVYTHRYGLSEADKQKPYAKRIAAKNPGTLWEVDGWTIPFYNKDKDKLVLFTVKDVHSRKIVGYSIGKSENTQMILEGLHDAVRNTGYLPFEIVSDNHVFHKTSEAENFKQYISVFGITWTVTSNPKQKSHIERGFRYFEEPCKEFPGYAGQGIKSRNKDGRPSQEYKDKHFQSRYLRTDDEIKLIAIELVENFNNTELKPLKGKTPNQVHDEVEKPAITSIDLYQRIALFTKRSEHKVSKGSIIIQRSGNKYDFRIRAEFFPLLNQKTVQVHYEDLKEEIYIYLNGEFVCTAKPAIEIHQAKHDQTEADIEALNKHKGSLKGIETQARNKTQSIADEVAKSHPDYWGEVNPKRTTKETLAYLLKHHEQRLYDMGIDPNKVESTPIPVYKEEETTNKSKQIFTPTGYKMTAENMFDDE